MDATTRSQTAVVTLPSETEILITRAFGAAPALVYRAWTTPELVRRWWSARRGEMTVAEIDLRVGGHWRYAMVTPGGDEVAFHGEYLEIVPGQRIVSTEVFEAVPDEAATNSASFDPAPEGTLLTILVRHATRAARDMHIASGMEDGLQDALDLLEEATFGG